MFVYSKDNRSQLEIVQEIFDQLKSGMLIEGFNKWTFTRNFPTEWINGETQFLWVPFDEYMLCNWDSKVQMFGFEQGFREMPHNIIDKKALAQAFSDYLSKGGHSQQVTALLNRNIPLLKGPHFLSCTTVFKCIVYLKNSKNEPIIGYILDNKANKTAEKRLFFVTTKYE